MNNPTEPNIASILFEEVLYPTVTGATLSSPQDP